MSGIFQRIESQFVERIGTLSAEELNEIERALDVLMNKVFY